MAMSSGWLWLRIGRYVDRKGLNMRYRLPLSLADLARPDRMAILRSAGERFRYDLAGVVETSATGESAFDWFADHPEYRRQDGSPAIASLSQPTLVLCCAGGA
jgi:hypothetical protein